MRGRCVCEETALEPPRLLAARILHWISPSGTSSGGHGTAGLWWTLWTCFRLITARHCGRPEEQRGGCSGAEEARRQAAESTKGSLGLSRPTQERLGFSGFPS